MSWTVQSLPNLQALSRMDACLRQVATDHEEIRRAIVMAAGALADARDDGDQRVEATMLGYLAEAHRIIGNLEEAEELARAGLAVAERGTARQRLTARVRLGEVLRCAARYDEAIPELQAAFGEIVDTETETYRDFILQHLGKTYLNMNRRDDAFMALREALRIRKRKGDEALVASTEEALQFAVSGKGVCRPGM